MIRVKEVTEEKIKHLVWWEKSPYGRLVANKHGYIQHSSIMETSDWASKFRADGEHLKATVKTFGRGIGLLKSSFYEDFPKFTRHIFWWRWGCKTANLKVLRIATFILFIAINNLENNQIPICEKRDKIHFGIFI